MFVSCQMHYRSASSCNIAHPNYFVYIIPFLIGFGEEEYVIFKNTAYFSVESALFYLERDKNILTTLLREHCKPVHVERLS